MVVHSCMWRWRHIHMKPVLTLEQLAPCGFNYSNSHCVAVVCSGDRCMWRQNLSFYISTDGWRSNEAKELLGLMVLGSDPRQKQHPPVMGNCIAGSACASYAYSSFHLQKMRNFRMNPPKIAVFSSDPMASALPSW